MDTAKQFQDSTDKLIFAWILEKKYAESTAAIILYIFANWYCKVLQQSMIIKQIISI